LILRTLDVEIELILRTKGYSSFALVVNLKLQVHKMVQNF